MADYVNISSQFYINFVFFFLTVNTFFLYALRFSRIQQCHHYNNEYVCTLAVSVYLTGFSIPVFRDEC